MSTDTRHHHHFFNYTQKFCTFHSFAARKNSSANTEDDPKLFASLKLRKYEIELKLLSFESSYQKNASWVFMHFHFSTQNARFSFRFNSKFIRNCNLSNKMRSWFAVRNSFSLPITRLLNSNNSRFLCWNFAGFRFVLLQWKFSIRIAHHYELNW